MLSYGGMTRIRFEGYISLHFFKHLFKHLFKNTDP